MDLTGTSKAIKDSGKIKDEPNRVPVFEEAIKFRGESSYYIIPSTSPSILPEKATKWLARIITYGGKLSYTPYFWDKESKHVRFKDDRKTKIMYFTQLFMVFLYQFYLLYKCTVILSSPKEKLQRKIRTSYMTFVYISLNFQHLGTVRQYGALHLLINNFREVTHRFNGLYGPIKMKHGKKVARVMKVVSFGVLVGCSNAFGVIVAPESPTVLTSLFENPRNLPLGVNVLLGLVHNVSINLFHFYPIAFYAAIIYYYVSTVVPVIRRMKLRMTKLHLQNHKDMQPQSLHRCYNEFGILQNTFNSIFSLWTIGIEIFAIVLVVLNIFQAVAFESIRALVLALCSGFVFMLLFRELSQVHEASVGSLAAWEMIMYPEWFRKYRRSCKPLSVALGSFYYADKGLCLTIMGVIFSSAANLIVTFRTSIDASDIHH